MSRQEKIQKTIFLLLFLFSFGFLAWNAATLRLEGYDGIEFAVSGLSLFGNSWPLHAKNIQQIVFLGAAGKFAKIFGFAASLTYFHLVIFSLHMAILVIFDLPPKKWTRNSTC